MLTTKRKLDFSTQQQQKEGRLPSAKGRCFYLDLVGRDDLAARYQQELTRRGAVSDAPSVQTHDCDDHWMLSNFLELMLLILICVVLLPSGGGPVL